MYLIRYETVTGCFFNNKEQVHELLLCAAEDERAKSIRREISPVLKFSNLCKGTSADLKKEITIKRI